MNGNLLMQRRVLLALGLALPTGAALGAGRAETEALGRKSLVARQPERAVLLAVARAGRRLVAVGERGLIVSSDDDGRAWAQAASPVSVTLTALRFADAKHGVAVGHGGVVLATADAGRTWAQRLDGRRAAALVLDTARVGGNPAALAAAERMVAEGPDKPFLDVQVQDASRIQVVGAYGLALASEDGGRSWTSWTPRLDNPKALHCYALRQRGDTVLIAGEQGLLLRSDDAGRSFRRLDTPYRGSFFTAELPADHEIVVAGLRGNAWRSTDDGRSWTQLASPSGASITSSLALPNGELLFTDQAGFVLKVAGSRLEPLNKSPLAPVNAIARADDRRLVALTAQGVALLDAGSPKT